jgi:hypothetical protein
MPTMPTMTPPRPMAPIQPLNFASYKAGFIGAMNAIAVVVAARMICGLAVCGAIALTYVALQNPDPYRIAILAIYAVGVVGSVVWLAGRA